MKVIRYNTISVLPNVMSLQEYSYNTSAKLDDRLLPLRVRAAMAPRQLQVFRPVVVRHLDVHGFRLDMPFIGLRTNYITTEGTSQQGILILLRMRRGVSAASHMESGKVGSTRSPTCSPDSSQRAPDVRMRTM